MTVKQKKLLRHSAKRSKVSTKKMSPLAKNLVKGIREMGAHLRGEITLETRDISTPASLIALRKKQSLSRVAFAKRFGLDPRTVEGWEQGRRKLGTAEQILLQIIDREPEAVERALRQ